MTALALLQMAENCEIDSKKVNEVEYIYGPLSNNTALKLISLNLDNRVLYEENNKGLRIVVLSHFEMLESSDFASDLDLDKELVPFIQWGEENIICYDMEEDEWVNVNVPNCEIENSEVDLEDLLNPLHNSVIL